MDSDVRAELLEPDDPLVLSQQVPTEFTPSQPASQPASQPPTQPTPAVLRLMVDNPEAVHSSLAQMTEGYQSGGWTIQPAIELPTGCRLAQKTANKKAGFGWVKMKPPGLGGRAEYYVHHLTVVAGAEDAASYAQVKELLLKGNQFSHRCHQPRCFAEGHIVLESEADNLARTVCKGTTWVVCPCGCGHEFNPCPHAPQCILPKDRSQFGWTSWQQQ